MTTLRVRSAAATDTGLVRSANEDSHLVREGDGVWLVADGMGGHANGQWASSTVVRHVAEARLTGDFEADAAALSDALQRANAEIVAAAAGGARMGSTAVLLLIEDGRFGVIWAGDSRAYLLRDGQLHRLSRDHTQVQELLDRGILSPAEAAGHPMSHVLSRAVGVQAELELEAVSDQARPRDVFLLCSDGLTGVVSEAEIAERLQMGGGVACRRLVELVLSRGAPDNVTVVAATCEETTALNLSPVLA